MKFLYGTAWKKDDTQRLVELALASGFRAIDTANQLKHYYEEGVGLAVQKFLTDGTLQRQDLFLQSKYTYLAGQDHRLPYDPQADFPTQVRQSLSSSLKHLHTDYLDSYLLHGPSTGLGLNDCDFEVWRTMESFYDSREVRAIGVSNVNEDQLRLLLESCRIKPSFVQNRCFARTRWDFGIRKLCREHGIVYQGFSLLTANAHELQRNETFHIARRLNATLAQVVFCFCEQIGILPLTGTTDAAHMREDLSSDNFKLTADEIQLIENIADLS